MKNGLIDYAAPLISIEGKAKEAHKLCLSHKYQEAQEVVLTLIAEARILHHTLTIMEEEAWKSRSK